METSWTAAGVITVNNVFRQKCLTWTKSTWILAPKELLKLILVLRNINYVLTPIRLGCYLWFLGVHLAWPNFDLCYSDCFLHLRTEGGIGQRKEQTGKAKASSFSGLPTLYSSPTNTLHFINQHFTLHQPTLYTSLTNALLVINQYFTLHEQWGWWFWFLGKWSATTKKMFFKAAQTRYVLQYAYPAKGPPNGTSPHVNGRNRQMLRCMCFVVVHAIRRNKNLTNTNTNWETRKWNTVLYCIHKWKVQISQDWSHQHPK